MGDHVRSQIKNKLRELSLRVNVEKITITMLVKECGISRTLFYYYYQDIQAVIVDILSTEMERITTESLELEFGKEAIKYFTCEYIKQLSFLKKVYRSSYYCEAENLITTILAENVKRILLETAGKRLVSIRDVEFLGEFIAGAVVSYFFRHCEDKNLDADEIAEYLNSIILSY